MYADTDFLLAILKDKDWLKENAEQIYKKHQGDIWTSAVTIQELLIIAKREGLEQLKLIEAVQNLVEVREVTLTLEVLVKAAHLMQEEHTTLFDPLQAIVCGDEAILSSDKIYDKLGLNRIKLEEKQ